MTPAVLREAARLKRVTRAGWLRIGVPSPESVADHSWGVAWLVLALLPPELDRGRALSYAVLHDLAEVRVGDLTPYDGVSSDEKHAAEDTAMQGLLGARPDLHRLWRAYEAQADPEAQFVRQLDRLDMAVQAAEYRDTHQVPVDEFFASAAAIITHPVLRPLLDALRAPTRAS